jgi:hypothetical protein
MRANIQTQALPGSNMQAEYPLCARFSGGVKKVQQLQPSPVRARSKDVQPLLVQLHDPGMYLGMLCHTTSGMICHLRSIHIISNPLLLSIHIIRRLWHESHTYHPYALYLGWPYRYALYTTITCCRGTPPTKLSAKARLVVACWKYGQESLGNPGSINVRAFLGHLFIFPACCCQMWLRGWFCWETRLTGSLKRPAKGLALNGPPP